MEPKKENGAFLLLIFIIAFALISSGESEGFNPNPQITPTSTSLSTPLGVDERVWRDISVAVDKAKENGIICDPILLYAIKLVETGSFYCDESWENLSRPNACASSEDVLGMYQFLTSTFERNAERYDVNGSVWNPQISSEVACYFINDETKISLTQTKEEFVEEFCFRGYIWNQYVVEATQIYEIGWYYLNLNKQ